MAYDASNTQNNQQQVAGSTPLSQGGGQSAPMAQGDQAPTSGPSTPATISPGQSSTQASQSQQPQQSNKPASSGMFTNIKSYVEKNQPAAQKMAGAVSQNVGDQASQIREQAEKKASDQKAALEANQKIMDQQKQEAANIIHSQTGIAVGGFQPPVQPAQPQVEQPQVDAEAQSKRFQELMQTPTGISQVGDLNLGQQQAKTQALQQMAQGANTEQGRMNLLKNTFGNQGETQYTRGLSGLDQLVVSGDQAAREQMIKGTQDQANQLQQQIANVGSEANKAKMAQDIAMKNFGADISNLSTEAQNQILAEVDANIESQRSALASEIEQMRATAASQFGENLQYGSTNDLIKGIMDNMRVDWNKEGDVEAFSNWSLGRALGMDSRTLDQLNKQRKQSFGGTFNEDSNLMITPEDRARLESNLYISQQQQNILNKQVQDMLKNAADYGIDTSKYAKDISSLGIQGTTQDILKQGGRKGGDQGNKMYQYDINKFKDTLGNIFSDINLAKENSLQRLLENKYGEQYKQALGEGQTFEDFASGKFLDRVGSATADQASKIEALQRLTGAQTNVLGTEKGTGVGQDTALFQALRERLAGQS